MVKEVGIEPYSRVLDPSCGSGTFLASTIRHKLSILNLADSKKATMISKTVYGMDIHPLAVIIAKANYLMALGDSLLEKEEDRITIPVYMCDSITFPEATYKVELFGSTKEEKAYGYEAYKGVLILLPKSLVDSGSADAVIDRIKDYAVKKAKGQVLPLAIFRKVLDKFGVTDDNFDIIMETADQLSELIKNKRDSIHAFILKNVYKPSTLEKFDIVIGNPPWLTYRDIRHMERQERLRKLTISKYTLLGSHEARLFTQMEMATLFYVRCADIYLHSGGKIAFVLPRSVFTGDQHKNFRENKMSIKLGYTTIFDLEKNQRERVTPLFSVESCVVIAEKEKDTEYPIRTKLFVGHLPMRNAQLTKVEELTNVGKFSITLKDMQLITIGNRTSWSYEDEIILNKQQSPYMKLFRQGATIYPRPFWFVSPVLSKVGRITSAPLMRTSERAARMAEQQNTAYKNIVIEKNIEKDYFYATLLGADILPFCNLPFRLVALPINPSGQFYRVVKKEDVLSIGHTNFYSWLSDAETYWKEGRKSKISKMDMYARLNRNNGISKQDSSSRFVILYNSAGRNNLVSCVANLEVAKNISFNGIYSRGFIGEHKTCLYYTQDESEAYYLTSIFNSNYAFDIVKRIKSARDIEKKILELPIPRYNSLENTHIILSQLGRECSLISDRELQIILKDLKSTEFLQTSTIGNLRKMIRNLIGDKLREIDQLVTSLLTLDSLGMMHTN
jgi:hypothetical protein